MSHGLGFRAALILIFRSCLCPCQRHRINDTYTSGRFGAARGSGLTLSSAHEAGTCLNKKVSECCYQASNLAVADSDMRICLYQSNGVAVLQNCACELVLHRSSGVRKRFGVMTSILNCHPRYWPFLFTWEAIFFTYRRGTQWREHNAISVDFSNMSGIARPLYCGARLCQDCGFDS